MTLFWLTLFNWLQLLIAFVLGVAAARWVMAGARGVAREDLLAEVAAERTKRQEAEAGRAKERARAAELDAQLSELQRRVRLGGGASASEAGSEPPDTSGVVHEAVGSALAAQASPAGQSLQGEADAAYDAALQDLTRINGVGPAYAARLADRGVASIADIARWNDDELARFDRELETGGAIRRQDWVGQAQRLTAQAEDERAAHVRSARVRIGQSA